MDIKDEIVKWVEGLPEWQKDIVKRLYESKALTEVHIEQIFKNILITHGISYFDKTLLDIQSLNTPQIQQTDSEQTVKLVAMTDFNNIAALNEKQRLDFEPNGLTIIYGDNSAGKSSYAKILKQACRAVDEKVKIHQNVFGTNKEQGTLNIHIDFNGTIETINRTINTPPTPLLSSISIFDSECSRIYVESENEAVFIPMELEIFDRLASTQTILKEKFNNKLTELEKLKPRFDEFKENTKIKQFLDQISFKTTEEEIISACSFSKNDETYLDGIERDLAILKTNDPVKIATELRRNAKDANVLKNQLEKINVALNCSEIRRFLEMDEKYRLAKKALIIATEDQFNAEPVKGAGTSPWRILWDAAKAFSENFAYPGESFPYINGYSPRCVLCHQELNDESKQRFNRFDAFVQNKVSEELEKYNALRASFMENVNKLPLNEVYSSSIMVLINQDNPLLGKKINEFIHTSLGLREFVMNAENQHEFNFNNETKTLNGSILDEIEDWAKEKSRIADEKEALSDKEKLIHLQREYNEFSDKKKVSKRIDDIEYYITILGDQRALQEAIKSVDTNKITRKMNELTENLISEEFISNFEKELQELDCEHIIYKVESKGKKGKTVLRINLDTKNKASLNEILSEGEQKGISLAFLLAEISTAQKGGGIILDDPVSSLDHNRREFVAMRLVKEAQNRQIVIFTHDIVFLLALQHYAKESKVKVEQRTIRRIGTIAGIAQKDLPWVAQNVKARIGNLKDRIQTLRKIENGQDEEEYRFHAKNWYMLLRETWERAVEELLLGNVVQRFSPGIQTQRLKDLKITPELISEVEKGMTKSSAWVHDQSAGMNKRPPRVIEIEDDLQQMEAFIKKFR